MKEFECGNCGDCGCEEGELHLVGCDHEICPICKKQLLSCEKHNWSDFIDVEREPYFKDTLTCIRCGKLFPNFIMVSEEQWKKICGCTYKIEDVLCPECMQFIILKRRIG